MNARRAATADGWRASLGAMALTLAGVVGVSLVAAAGWPRAALLRVAWVAAAWSALAALLAWMFVPDLPRPRSRAIRRVGGARHIALTFDDGPHPETTPGILDALARCDVRATFFLVGERVRRHPDLARRIAAAGHTLGNHTERHRLLVFRTTRQVAAEIAACQDSIHGVVGVRAALFRPPHGFVPVGLGATLRAHGLRLVTWQGHVRDTDAPGADVIAARALYVAAGGRILLLHDNPTTRGQTAAALPAIVAGCRARGYTFVPLP